MAHAGHELALGLAGGLGHVARGLQLQGALALVGDIVEQAVDPRLATRQHPRAGALAQPAQAAAGVADAQGHVGGREGFFVFALLHQQPGVFGQHQGLQQVGVLAPVGHLQAQHLIDARADVIPLVARRVADENALVDGLDQLAVAGFGLAQAQLVAALAGDVAQLRDHHPRRAVAVLHRHVARTDDAPALDRRPDELVLDRARALEHLVELGVDALAQARAQHVVEPAVARQRRDTELQLGMPVQRQHLHLPGVDHQQADRQVFGQRRHQLALRVDAGLVRLAARDVGAQADELQPAGGLVDHLGGVDLQPVRQSRFGTGLAAPGDELVPERAAAGEQAAQLIGGITAREVACQRLPQGPTLHLQWQVAGDFGKGRVDPFDPALRVGDHGRAAGARGQHRHLGELLVALAGQLQIDLATRHRCELQGQHAQQRQDIGPDPVGIVELQRRQRRACRPAVGGGMQAGVAGAALAAVADIEREHRQHQHMPHTRCPPAAGAGRAANRAVFDLTAAQRPAQRAFVGLDQRELGQIDPLVVDAGFGAPGLHQARTRPPLHHLHQPHALRAERAGDGRRHHGHRVEQPGGRRHRPSQTPQPVGRQGLDRFDWRAHTRHPGPGWQPMQILKR